MKGFFRPLTIPMLWPGNKIYFLTLKYFTNANLGMGFLMTALSLTPVDDDRTQIAEFASSPKI